jgi:hypothetical protein
MSLCNACNVRLGDDAALKAHYQSGWHAANLQVRHTLSVGCAQMHGGTSLSLGTLCGRTGFGCTFTALAA